MISNVPGPREDLYFAGAKLDAYIPVSTIGDGIGLNITVHSYKNRLDFGLISDRYLVPDFGHLVDLHIAEIASLFEATGAEWAEPQSPPSMRFGGDGGEPHRSEFGQCRRHDCCPIRARSRPGGQEGVTQKGSGQEGQEVEHNGAAAPTGDCSFLAHVMLALLSAGGSRRHAIAEAAA